MRVPVLQSKLKIPQLPPVVVGKERLQNLSRNILSHPLVSVTAPAGYGKTTLMAAALQEGIALGHRACWYRLGKEDRDLSVFYSHLLESLIPPEREEIKCRLGDWGDLPTRYRHLNAGICRELWELTEASPLKTLIALDDVQHILEVPEILFSLQFLIDNLPENFSVILGSRQSNGMLTGKRRLEKRVLEITRKDLGFSAQETAAFIQGKTRFAPGEEFVQEVLLRTEGWPAGIILFCQLLDQGDPYQATLLLGRLGKEELFFEYMASEVLQATEEDLLRFLVKASILKECTGPQAAEIFGEEKAPELLERFHEKGLFVQKISAKETIFHIHSLFREVLVRMQPRYLPAEEVKHYHLQAAAYYMKHQVFNQAIEHFILCGQVDLAVGLIARESVRLLAFQAVEELRIWLKLLPEEVVAGSGHLLYIKSFINYQKGTEEAQELLEQALHLFQQAGDGTMQLHTLIAMAHLKILQSDIRGLKKIQGKIAGLSKALTDPSIRNMAIVFDFTLAVWEEKFPKAHSLCKQVESLDLFEDWQWLALTYGSQMYYLTGDLDRAEEKILKALGLDLVNRAELLKGYTQLLYAMVLYLQDELKVHPRVLKDIIAIGEKCDYKYLLAFGRRLEAFLFYHNHDVEHARISLDASTSLFEAAGNRAMVAVNKLCRALWLSGSQDPRTLLADARKSLQILIARPSGQCFREMGLSALGAVAREAGDWEMAEKYLLKSLERSRVKGAAILVAGTCLHLAKFYYDTDRPDRGEKYLREGFTLAAERRYFMFWDLHFPTLLEMSIRALRLGLQAPYIMSLLARYFGEEGAEGVRRAAWSPGESGETSASFLSRYTKEGDPGKPMVCVNLLGKFTVSVNGLAIPEDSWKTKKTVGILKYLLLNRNHPVSKDRVMDTFWPGAEKNRASASLRVALHELKKVLRQNGLAETSFLLEEHGRLGVKAGKSLEVDVDVFLACYAELQKPGGERDVIRKKELLENMAALYRGDLLEEELYEDWAFTEREELRALFLEAALDLADLYRAEGDVRGAEKLLLSALTLDEFNEEACLRLLQIYLNANQRSRALKFYTKFADKFTKELNIKPDGRLSGLFKN
jgi:LuxR family transcriptional regulator, maltose regulon positive regulatory protein